MIQSNLLNILIIGPLLFGIGYKNPLTNMEFYNYITLLGAITPFISSYPEKSVLDWNFKELIMVIYILLQMWLFIYIGYNRDSSSEYIYHILKIYGLSLIIIHLYILVSYLIKKFNLNSIKH